MVEPRPQNVNSAALPLYHRGAADAIAGPDLSEGMPARPPLRPAEQMLLGSIVGLAICALWIWFSARAWL